MRKKILIVNLVLIILVIASFFFYWYNPQNIKNNVLNYLEQKLEFCEIIKDDIQSNQEEFWLICNNRPFYATYENGNVNYELNGWGFLKNDSSLWNELKDCDFYDSRDSQLIFYCPKNFNSSRITAKIYSFDTNLLKMNKIEEKDFLDILTNDVKKIYSFLSFCEIKDFTSFEIKIPTYSKVKYPAVLWITLDCGNESYVIGTDLTTVQLQPPILSNELSHEERAKISFKRSFNQHIKDISLEDKTVSILSSFNGNEFSIKYNFEELPTINYQISCSETKEKCLSKISKYFVLPPLEKTTSIENINNLQSYSTYKVDGAVIAVRFYGEDIIGIWRNTEGIYR